ncbi:MAG: hypothetical protein ACYTGO_19585, partial [Planctomycetota bacterium]
MRRLLQRRAARLPPPGRLETLLAPATRTDQQSSRTISPYQALRWETKMNLHTNAVVLATAATLTTLTFFA